MKPAREWMKGYYPQEENELMVTRDALSDCGKENLGVGDSFLLTYRDKVGEHTKEFLISGIWEGYGTQNVFYVSEAFYKESGYQLDYNGTLNLKFKNTIVMQKSQSQLLENLEISKRQHFLPMVESEKMIWIFGGVAGLVLITCLSAYLLIYNILYLWVSGNIRYYGLLQTVGMTPGQIGRFLFKQILWLGTAGMLVGFLLGIIVSFRLIPSAVKSLGIHSLSVEISFRPVIVLMTVLLVGITLYLCGRKPARIAVSISPVAAMGYQTLSSDRQSHKTRKANIAWRMAAEQLRKDKKKSGIVILSLASSLSVFLCLTTLIQSQSARTVISNFMDTDIVIQNDTLMQENTNEWQHIMESSLLDQIRDIEGVKEAIPLLCIPIIVPWEPDFSDPWMREFYEVWKDYPYDRDIAEYKKQPENFFSVLKVINEEEFNYLADNLEIPVDKEAFIKGETCIIYRSGLSFDINQLKDKNVKYSVIGKAGKLQQKKIAGLTEDVYYASPTGGAPIVIVSDFSMKQMEETPYISKINIRYKDEYDQNTEAKIKKLVNHSPYVDDFSWDSKIENMKEIEKAQGNMMEVGVGISLILAFIGCMNYVNTVTGNIQNRSVTLSILESVGMTPNQVRKMLIREGFLYAAGTLLLTATVGLGMTYVCYHLINYRQIVFQIPVGLMLAAIAVLLVVCTIVPLVSCHYLAGRGTIAERIKGIE